MNSKNMNYIYHILKGGGDNNSMSSSKMVYTILITSIFSLLIRAYLVQWSYNALMPKFIITLGDKKKIKNFSLLSYSEALVFVIGVQSLVSKY